MLVGWNDVLDETRTAERLVKSSCAHARLSKFTSGSRPSSSRPGILRCLLLVTGPWGKAKYLLSLDGMTVNTTSCQFQLQNHTKTSKTGQMCKPLVIKKYISDPTLCPLSTLKEYIQKTKPLQNSEKQLFISCIQPHKAVSHDTIWRWTKDVF